jgi:hypothetical protein
MFNYYFDADRDAHADTVTLFEECAMGKFVPFTSDYVMKELSNAPEEKRDKMFGLIKLYDIQLIYGTEESDALASRYLEEGALPPGSIMDASHIAIASVNSLDMVVSLNFRHIVRMKTIRMTSAINSLSGYSEIKVFSPMEVIDDEKSRYHLGRDSRNPP